MTVQSNHKFVFLITIDCLRFDHLRFYGYKRNTAPNQEEFIKNGTVFINTIANGPETASSFSSIFSSILPCLSGGFCPLPNQKKPFTVILNENKVFSYGIHSNPYLGKNFKYDRGFDVFIDGLEQNSHNRSDKLYGDKETNKKSLMKKMNNLFRDIIFKYILERIIVKLSKQYKPFEIIRNKLINIDIFKDIFTKITRKYRNIGFTAYDIVKEICKFIINFKFQKPLFLWAHFMDAHWPYNPPPKDLLNFRESNISSKERDFLLNKVFWNNNMPQIFKKHTSNAILSEENLKNLIDLYDGSIFYIDRNLKAFFNLIKRNIKKNCLIIITADYGEAFFEHEYLNHSGHLFEELLRIPLYIVELGKKSTIRKIDEAVQLLNIAPTILDYFGIKIPKEFQGKSLLPLMRGDTLPRKDYIISESYQTDGKFNMYSKISYKIFSIRKKPWKYIFNEQLNQEYIFNIEEDPKERNNLIEKKIEILSEFRRIKNKHFQEIDIFNEQVKIIKAIKDLDFRITNI